MAALEAEPKGFGPALVQVPALDLESKIAVSEGSRSLSGDEAGVVQEQADGSPMGAVVGTYFEEALEGVWGPVARSWQRAVEVAEREAKRQ